MSNHQDVMNKIEIVDKKKQQRKLLKLQHKTKPKLLK